MESESKTEFIQTENGGGSMRKIKLNGTIHTIDISDGKGLLPFGMNGVGGMTIKIDGKVITDNGRCENTNMLDGTVNFTMQRNLSECTIAVYDNRKEKLSEIHKLDYTECDETEITEKVNIILFGLKYYDIDCIDYGYRIGKELTYRDFCIAFNKTEITVFKSSHGGFIAPEYISMMDSHEYFDKLFRAIKKSINRYFYS